MRLRNKSYLAEEKDKLNPNWIKGVKKWWKQLVAESKKFDGTKGKRAGEKAIAYLEDVNKQVEAFKRDLWLDKMLWPGRITGDKKRDRRDLRSALFMDLEEAEDLLYRKLKLTKTFYNAIHDRRSVDAKKFGAASRKKVYGKGAGKNALDNELETFFGDMLGVDRIMSRKVFRRLTEYINKSNPHGTEDALDEPALREFNVGRVRVLVNYVPKETYHTAVLLKYRKFAIDPSYHSWIVKAVTSAKSLIEKAGFGRAWYGTVTVDPPGRGREYKDKVTGDEYRVAGGWAMSDEIKLFGLPVGRARAQKAVEILVHEVGHRWFYKFMSKGERDRFGSYFSDVPAVSEYGGTNASEDFAEVFAWYVMGKKLTRDQRERFKQFALKGGEIRRQEDVSELRDELIG